MAKATKDRKPLPIRREPTELNKDIGERDTGEQDEARERALDETLAATFPASDPFSSDPNPGSEDRQEDKVAS